MEHRDLGRTGLRVSVVGLGAEHLLNQPRKHVAEVISRALDAGIDYYDLFLAQPDFRDNMGAAFAGRRQQVILAAHLGPIDRNGQYEISRDVALTVPYVYDFLRRLRTDYVDLLFIHCCDEADDYARAMDTDGPLGAALRLREQGLVRALGFSGHTVETSRQAVESGFVDVLMFPVNMAGHAVEGRDDLLRACAQRGVGVVAMKVYVGGTLFAKERLLRLERWVLGGADRDFERKVTVTPVQCLAYALDRPGVATTVPGVRTLPEVEAALAYVEASPEQRDYGPVLAAFDEHRPGECVYCNHCLPCPVAIDIGNTVRLLDLGAGGVDGELERLYAALPTPASECIACGDCVARCPFGCDPMSLVAQAAARYESA